MDALDIIENLHNVKPVFQPIISASKHMVIGYEVLGRYHSEGDWISLGDFFHDHEVPDEYKAEVDQHLLESAISTMLAENSQGCLFINRSAKQLLLNSGEDFLMPLRKFEKMGFSMDRIVLEITEHDFAESFDSLCHLLIYYKTYGIQISLDHVGAKSSNIDRIRQLRPHILKIDASLIRNNDPTVFQDILYSLSVLARRIGAKFAYEKIEENHQLYFAWKHGAHYYQGFHLAEPAFQLLREDSLAIRIGDETSVFVRQEKSRIERRLAFTVSCEEKAKKLVAEWQGYPQADLFIKDTISSFDVESFRIYICDSDGLQVSSNFRKRQDVWNVESFQKGSHWAFRPYFLENLMQMKTWNKGILSETYSDIETGEMIRTFSYPLSSQHFLFVDISHAFIAETDYLLFE